MSELPDSWLMGAIADLVDVGPKNQCDDSTVVGFVPMNRMGKSFRDTPTFEARKWSEVKKGYTHFADGDVLVARITPCFENGKAGIARGLPNGMGAGSTEYVVLRPKAGVATAEYVLARLKTDEFLSKGAHAMTGAVGQQRVPKAVIESYPVPIAPFPEQQRISLKLTALLADVDACRERLDRVPQILKKFREGVLEAAVSGRLTEEWRAAHVKQADAPTFKGVEAAADEAAQKADVKRWKQRKYEEYPELDIPPGWLQGRVGDVALHRSGVAYKSERFVKSGLQVVRLGNLYQGRLDLGRNPVFISSPTANDEEFLAKTGDILVSQTGTRYKGDYGHCVLIDSDRCEVLVNQRILCLSATKAVLPRFLAYYGNTTAFRNFFFTQETGGVNQGNVGVGGVMDAPCPIPGLPEQAEIVRRVDALLNRGHGILRQYEDAASRVERLTPSVLAKAFRGELVPQDPNDKPACEMLESIKRKDARA